MNTKHIKIVLKKELKDLFRDKRTWLAGIIIPVMVFPLMFYLMGLGKNNMESKLERDVPIAIIANGQGAQLIDHILQAGGITIITTDDPYGALQRGEVKTIIQLGENFEEKIQKEIPADIKLIFDEVSSESAMVTSKVEVVLWSYSETIRLDRLEKLGVNPDILYPTAIVKEAYIPEGQESKGDSTALMLLTFLLPFLLMLYPVVGGMPAAIDLGAGEKERLSLEPLLSTAADRLSILVGKYLTILVTSIIGVITSLIGMLGASKLTPDMIPMGIKISPLSILILVVMSLLMAMMLSGVMLSISVFAKSYKEAGTYLSPITIVLMVPAYLTMFMDIRTLSTTLFYVPILNVVLLMKEVLVDIINPLHLGITFSISLLMVLASLVFTRFMFSKESVIFRS